MRLIAPIVLAAAIALPLSACGSSETIAGKWACTSTAAGDAATLALNVTYADDGKIAGTWTVNGKAPQGDLVIKGDAGGTWEAADAGFTQNLTMTPKAGTINGETIPAEAFRVSSTDSAFDDELKLEGDTLEMTSAGEPVNCTRA